MLLFSLAPVVEEPHFSTEPPPYYRYSRSSTDKHNSMVETVRSQSRGKNLIDPSFTNSPYLSSPIRPVPSTKKQQQQPNNNNNNSQKDGIAPLRDITVSSSKSPTSLLKSAGRSRSAGRQRLLLHDDADADEGCSLANSTICTTRTAAAARPSPYLMGAGGGGGGGSGGGRSTSARRAGRNAASTSAGTKKPPSSF